MSLSCTVTTKKGESMVLVNPISAEFTADLYDISNKFEAVFPFPDIDNHTDFISIEVFSDSTLIFSGMIDQQIDKLDQNGRFFELHCTSYHARMVQNQVQPDILANYTSQQLFEDYAEPYGITSHNLFPTTCTRLEVTVGMTAWQVIDLFCRQNYRCIPLLTRDGMLTIDMFSYKYYEIGNQDGAHHYTSISYIDDRSSIVSTVHMKASENKFDYSDVYENLNAQEYNIQRERYYRPPESWAGLESKGAAEVIRNSNIKSRIYQITIPEILDAYPGDLVTFKDDRFKRLDFYIGHTTVRIDKNGAFTNLILWDMYRV